MSGFLMIGKKRKVKYFNFLLLIIFSILFSYPAESAVIGISPGIIDFNGMVREGYAERSVIVTTSSKDLVLGHIDVDGEIADWVSFDPRDESFNLSTQTPYRFTIKMNPGSAVENGNYSGKVRVITDKVVSVDEGAGSSIISAVAIVINVEIIDKEIISCNAGAFSISDTEVGMPFRFQATIENLGNVRLRPEIKILVYDKDKQELEFQKTFFGDRILPTTSSRLIKDIDNNLLPGQYFADVYLEECGISKWLSFDVFEKGGIIDEGEFIGIRSNKISYVDVPVPLMPVFKNVGPRPVLARFIGKIIDMDGERLIDTIETEELVCEPGQEIEFPFYYTFDVPGDYQVSGKIIYNNKVSFDELSEVIHIREKKETSGSGTVLLAILYLLIGIGIIILLGKIKKAKKKKY